MKKDEKFTITLSEEELSDKVIRYSRKLLAEKKQMDDASSDKITGKNRRKRIDWQLNVPTLAVLVISVAVTFGVYINTINNLVKHDGEQDMEIKANRTLLDKHDTKLDLLMHEEFGSISAAVTKVNLMEN